MGSRQGILFLIFLVYRVWKEGLAQAAFMQEPPVVTIVDLNIYIKMYAIDINIDAILKDKDKCQVRDYKDMKILLNK